MIWIFIKYLAPLFPYNFDKMCATYCKVGHQKTLFSLVICDNLEILEARERAFNQSKLGDDLEYFVG